MLHKQAVTQKLMAVLCMALALGFFNLQGQPAEAASESPTQIQQAPLPNPGDLSTAIAKVAQEATPAVVHIQVTQRKEVTNPFEGNPLFQQFFGQQMPKKFRQEMVGIGSGIITDAQGHILTNNHVVDGATKIQVTLADGSQYPAKVIGTDAKTDLAVIKIDGKNQFPHLPLGDSDKIGVGDWVVAIGAPQGLDQTVTQGIISAKHRTGISDPDNYQDFLQTDAAINPGNSGGPLLNLRGEVIGINTAIATESGGSEGIGFAIPSKMAARVEPALIAYGKVERGWLGVSIKDVNAATAKSIGLPEGKGVLIADVVKGSPAAEAGLKKGDVVWSFQGKPVSDSSTLRNEVADTPIGQKVTLSVWRNKTRQDISVKIANLQESVKLMSAELDNRLGVAVRPVTSKEDEEFGIDPGEGVAVTKVKPQGPLAKVGLEPQDFILQINGEDVTGVEGFENLISSLPEHHPVVILALDHRTGQTGYMQVDLG